jgi:hypothetical protein
LEGERRKREGHVIGTRSGSGLFGDDDGEGYINGGMVRAIEHGEG